MAMEGKLIPQDSSDEPASVLLEIINEEKEQLIKEKKIKRNNRESFIFRKNDHFYEKLGKNGEEFCIDDEIPWDIPYSWEWCRLGSLISIISGVSYNKGDIASEGIRILRGGNIQDTNVLLLDDDIYLPKTYHNPIKEVKKGDILIVASTGSKKVIGKPGFVKEDYENVSIGAFLRICRPIINYLSEYIQLIFASEYYRNHIRTLSQGTNINNVKKEYLENLFIPLPPLEEQNKILKKIKLVLPLIDNYNANEEKLEKLNVEFPSKIKGSILQDAMEGKLVLQDSSDEPASVLLEIINEEKEQLIKEKKIKRNNRESFIFRKNDHFYEKLGKNGEEFCIDDEIPWDIPYSWEWCRLGSLISIISGVSYNKGDIASEGIRILRGGNIQDTNVLLLDDDIYLPKTYHNPIKEVKKGDILIVASTGSKKVIGKPGFVKEDYENVSIGAFLRICRPIINYLSEYIQLIFASEYYRNHIRTLSQGTNINNVKKEYVENLLIPLPPLSEQKRIIKKKQDLFGILVIIS